MKITQKRLNEIIASHGKWLHNEAGGERADLSYINLSGADLHTVNLSNANLSYANLSYADLYDVNLSGANLIGANFSHANLRYADLSNTDLSCTNFRCANLDDTKLCGTKLYNVDLCATNLSKTYYQIVRIGSRNAITTYCIETDNVTCGCWNDYKGGTLAEFRDRIESVYGENGETLNNKYYAQYTAAIEFFEKMAELAKERK